VVQDQSFDQLGFCLHFVFHVHDFDHVQVNFTFVTSDAQTRVSDDVGQLFGHVFLQFGVQTASGHLHERVSLGVDVIHFDFHFGE